MRTAKSRPLAIVTGLFAAANLVTIGYRMAEGDIDRALLHVAVFALCALGAWLSWE